MAVATPQYNAQVATRSSNVAAQPEVQADEYAPQIIPDRYTHGKTSRPLRILIVATEAPPVRGGIARVVGYLRDGFQAYGHHVDVLAYPNVGRVSLGEVRLSSLSFKLPQVFRHFKEYDVIHVHGATPTISDVMLLFTRMYSSRPVIVYTHHMDLDFGPVKLLNKAYNYMHRQFSAQADAVIAGHRTTYLYRIDVARSFPLVSTLSTFEPEKRRTINLRFFSPANFVLIKVYVYFYRLWLRLAVCGYSSQGMDRKSRSTAI